MTVKMFEIRDAGTTISALAVRLDQEIEALDPDTADWQQHEAVRWLLTRAGFGTTVEAQAQYVLLLMLGGSSGTWSCDPYSGWGRARTMPIAQQYINEHFDELASGAVVDVEFIQGERSAPKTSDRFYSREVGA